MPSTRVSFDEGDVVRMVLEFLDNRSLNISGQYLERETGVINGAYSDDLLFLRQLILDGQWDDVLEFVQPLSSVDGFDSQTFNFTITKHKFLELLCIRSETDLVRSNTEGQVDEVVKCVNALEELSPSRTEYSDLCLLLTLSRLSDHADYRNWNPSVGRSQCFKKVCPLLQHLLPMEKSKLAITNTSTGDRLVQLLLKGLLYESCVDFCQHRATSSGAKGVTTPSPDDLKMSDCLTGKNNSFVFLNLVHILNFCFVSNSLCRSAIN